MINFEIHSLLNHICSFASIFTFECAMYCTLAVIFSNYMDLDGFIDFWKPTFDYFVQIFNFESLTFIKRLIKSSNMDGICDIFGWKVISIQFLAI